VSKYLKQRVLRCPLKKREERKKKKKEKRREKR
jgi:hypothetical protein